MFTAYTKDKQREVHISDITRGNTGQKCNCICKYCGKSVEAVKKKKDPTFTDRFRHISGPACYNSVIHEEAINIIIDSDVINLPSGRNQKYDNPQREYEFTESDYRADVMVLTEHSDIAIEVKVWHDCQPDKVEFYKQQSFRSFKISLDPKKYAMTNGELCQGMKSTLVEDVLQGNNREWYKKIDPTHTLKEIKPNNSDEKGGICLWFVGVFGLILMLFGLKNLKRKKGIMLKNSW